jgi:hypothetical protein
MTTSEKIQEVRTKRDDLLTERNNALLAQNYTRADEILGLIAPLTVELNELLKKQWEKVA